jgi:colanic acid/amylovoran biosynthesis glycosyltransferase
LRQRIEKKIRALNLGDEVEMLGWINQSEIQNEFDRADLFLLPSVTSNSGDQEGTPTALLEAQACGVPVVSTLHAGIPEIVLDGVTGFLVEEGNVNSLVLGLEKLLGMPDRWEEMGKEGRKHVLEVHSIPVMTRRLEKLYNSVTKIDD